MILGTLGAGYYAYHYGVWAGLLGGDGLRRRRRRAPRGGHGRLRRRPHRVRRRGQHHRRRRGGLPRRGLFSGLEGGGPTQSPSLRPATVLTIPGISDAAGDLADKGWFLVSDLAAVVAALTTGVRRHDDRDRAVRATAWLLWRTPSACGCAPAASSRRPRRRSASTSTSTSSSPSRCRAHSPVLGGAYLAMVASSGYSNGQTLGLGYIGLAAMIFGNWRPGGLLPRRAAVRLHLRRPAALRWRVGARAAAHGRGRPACVLLVWQLSSGAGWPPALAGVRRRCRPCGGYFATDEVPSDFTEMTPYVATLLVLALASQ